MKRLKIPRGFKVAGVACGIKKSGKKDLALILSDVPASAAGVFTTNQVKAAPILVSQKQIKKRFVSGIIANSGNANCWTGEKGLSDARKMAQGNLLVASTGSIGHPLPIEKIIRGKRTAFEHLSSSSQAFRAAANAILTTDTRPKIISRKVGGATVLGMAKGSGMIAPAMATMHAFIFTDAKIGPKELQRILKPAVDKSFNMVSVDNCMSTNDCVFVLANGKSGIRVKGQGSSGKFYQVLEQVCIYLAKEIARDGEGATKLMEVRVEGSRSESEARAAVKAIIGSFLLKAAVYGKDKNFGRILQAVGATQVKVNWKKFKWNWKIGGKEDIITVSLGAGKSSAVGWGCDLTEGYVRINARYHT